MINNRSNIRSNIFMIFNIFINNDKKIVDGILKKYSNINLLEYLNKLCDAEKKYVEALDCYLDCQYCGGDTCQGIIIYANAIMNYNNILGKNEDIDKIIQKLELGLKHQRLEDDNKKEVYYSFQKLDLHFRYEQVIFCETILSKIIDPNDYMKFSNIMEYNERISMLIINILNNYEDSEKSLYNMAMKVIKKIKPKTASQNLFIKRLRK